MIQEARFKISLDVTAYFETRERVIRAFIDEFPYVLYEKKIDDHEKVLDSEEIARKLIGLLQKEFEKQE
jgi:hypothetical protein